ncbi:MAG: SLC13 family permease, partial [Promethearchaeota archaeon]
MKNADFVAISLICMFTGATITFLVLEVQFTDFIQMIEWEAIIIILSMSLITKVAQDSNILEFVAVKLFKLSRGNQRAFLYLLCIITT